MQKLYLRRLEIRAIDTERYTVRAAIPRRWDSVACKFNEYHPYPRDCSLTSNWIQVRAWRLFEIVVDVLFFLLQTSHARWVLRFFIARKMVEEVPPSLNSSSSDDMLNDLERNKLNKDLLFHLVIY